MFSDVLYQPHLCAWADLRPEWLEGETIDRVSAKSLSLQDFLDRYERPNRPVIITDLVPNWRRVSRSPHVCKIFGVDQALMSGATTHAIPQGERGVELRGIQDPLGRHPVPRRRLHHLSR